MQKRISLKINGIEYSYNVTANRTLAELLRDQLGLTGTKIGCQTGACGSCTVLLDGEAVLSCMLLAVEAEGKEVVTIEGLAKEGVLDRVQQAFVEEGAVQCGFCTPGMILSAKSLLLREPSPSEEEIRVALSGNLCRCTGYVKIIRAVQHAAQL